MRFGFNGNSNRHTIRRDGSQWFLLFRLVENKKDEDNQIVHISVVVYVFSKFISFILFVGRFSALSKPFRAHFHPLTGFSLLNRMYNV